MANNTEVIVISDDEDMDVLQHSFNLAVAEALLQLLECHPLPRNASPPPHSPTSNASSFASPSYSPVVSRPESPTSEHDYDGSIEISDEEINQLEAEEDNGSVTVDFDQRSDVAMFSPISSMGSLLSNDEDNLTIIQEVLDVAMAQEAEPMLVDVPVDKDDIETDPDDPMACPLCYARVVRVGFFCTHNPCCGTCVNKLEVDAQSTGDNVRCPICRYPYGYMKLRLP